jgi:hypothetical protein
VDVFRWVRVDVFRWVRVCACSRARARVCVCVCVCVCVGGCVAMYVEWRGGGKFRSHVCVSACALEEHALVILGCFFGYRVRGGTLTFL